MPQMLWNCYANKLHMMNQEYSVLFIMSTGALSSFLFAFVCQLWLLSKILWQYKSWGPLISISKTNHFLFLLTRNTCLFIIMYEVDKWMVIFYLAKFSQFYVTTFFIYIFFPFCNFYIWEYFLLHQRFILA